ncbi:hypothetical protein [Kribbella shirazensis]|uniref:Uncharacterized protein n=1 Tax=Kribbella shirazensis TaxID=1105143 RepID=A0A7X5V8H7_9ACTN|nr:hypothetical protein [Kribbella shirazensis]NIK56517.1 hypothetical protein [Kribbella shirazensis]
MERQQSGDSMQPPAPMSDEEKADLRRFLGSYTAADRPGVPRKTGEKPDNVRRLDTRRDRDTTKEVD